MNIVQYIDSVELEKGGVVRAVLDLSQELAKAGHHVSIISHNLTDLPGTWDGTPGYPNGLHISAEKAKWNPILTNHLQTIQNYLKQADVAHLHGIWYPGTRQIASLCKKQGVPYIVTPHGMLDEWCMNQKGLKKKIYLALGGRAMLQNAQAVHCTALAEARQSEKYFPKGRAEVVPLVFDLSHFSDLPGTKPARQTFPELFNGKPILLFLSRLHQKKGVTQLISAARLLRERDVEFNLAIAGTGDPNYEKQIQDQIQSSRLNDSVQMLNFVSGIEKVSLYESADLFVLPTFQENWGFVTIEAMATGTPALTTKGVDIWPELEASGGAKISDGTPEAFADSIELLLQDKARLTQMGHTARQWVLNHFDTASIVNRYTQMYTGKSI